MKIDLHCHSKHSKRPSLWLMQKLGCPESFTEPAEIYRLCREKGMSAVTITDHNVIDGALAIAGLPGAFIGCEYTTYFPEDRCKVHVLVYGQNEEQHREITEARENIYDFVEYLRDHGLTTVCAHPFFWVNDRLTAGHIEKLVLLFKNWELNGDMHPAMNRAVESLAAGLTPGLVGRLADKHGIHPHFAEPWKKNLTTGSDDHSSLNLARAYTEVPYAQTLEEFWDGVAQGQARTRIREAGPETFARNVYSIAYQFYKAKFDLERYVNKDVFLRFLDRTLQTRPEAADPWMTKLTLFVSQRRTPKRKAPENRTLLEMARFEAEKLIRHDPQLSALVRSASHDPAELDRLWLEFVNRVSDKVLLEFGEGVLDRLIHGRIFDLFHSLGSAGALYMLLAPYFVSYSLFAREKKWGEEVAAAILEGTSPADEAKPNVAHFTDTYDDVNGVARTLRRQVQSAQRLGLDYTVIGCFPEGRSFERGVRPFAPVGAFELPEYPELTLLAPPFLQMLHHCYEAGYTHLHVSTPGPVGLAALGIARILHLPITGTYHTAIPQYAKALTDDTYVEEVMWKSMVWFYDQLDAVYAPSEATGRELAEKGVSPSKIKVYPRGVDTDRFHPAKRNGVYTSRYGVADGAVRMLYVGRVSKEKNLHVLTDAYRSILAAGWSARLAIVGDGPYRAEMESALAGTPALFTGFVEGDALAELYASSDFLVFPSATDTFGNVVLEAQASGIPVIVTDRGGPCENVAPGETGLVVAAGSAEALAGAMAALIDDAPRRTEMGQAARAYMETRGFDAAFERLWAMYTEPPAAAAPDGDDPLARLMHDALDTPGRAIA